MRFFPPLVRQISQSESSRQKFMQSKFVLNRTSFVRLMSWKTRNDRPIVKSHIPDGCLFAPLRKGAQITFSHPLDDEEAHLKFLREELPDEFADLAPSVLRYNQRLVEMIKYNTPAFHSCWTFGSELFYKTLVPREKQTEEDLRKCRLLRACVELKFAFTTVLDDIADGSDTRKGKSAWKKVCGERISVAMYDGILLDLLPYHIARKYFRDSPAYSRILEAFQKASLEMVMGETLDVMAHHQADTVSSEDFKKLYDLKAGCFIAMQPTLGILLAGIRNEELIAGVERIFYESGRMIQSWDDFCDYYCTSGQTGKPSCDFQNAGTTWASTTALRHFSDEQKRIFKECYGSTDPVKVETVRHLYDAVNLPALYVDFMKSQARKLALLIADLDNAGCRESCSSWLRWLVGDAQNGGEN